MTEAAGSERAEMERKLIERGLQDESFRQRLLADPRGAIEEELESRLPEEVQVVAVEETADTMYLVSPPPTTRATARGNELADQELEGVAGGGSWSTCQGAAGKVVQWC